jgi:formylglycine-generating enzyme required for sulfatase activity
MTKSLFRMYLLGAAAGLCLVSTAGHAQTRPDQPELVIVPAGERLYRASGEYLRDGRAVDGPERRIEVAHDLEIMKYQVSVADYALCVADKACDAPLNSRATGPGLPVTGVSFKDAGDYAAWLSRRTGGTWRLPSDEEWAYAAGSRFVDDALSPGRNDTDPSVRWLLKYEKYAGLSEATPAEVAPRGSFGANENGLYDMSGNVWEWTESCYDRWTISDTGNPVRNGKPNCGVRIAEGQHRAYITFFVKDAKGGGCSAGAPPEYLGFRLVRDAPRQTGLGALRAWWKSGRGR